MGLVSRRLGRDCYLSFHNPANFRTLLRERVNAPAFFPTMDSYWVLAGQNPCHTVHSRVDSGSAYLCFAYLCFSDNASLAGLGLYPFCQKTWHYLQVVLGVASECSETHNLDTPRDIHRTPALPSHVCLQKCYFRFGCNHRSYSCCCESSLHGCFCCCGNNRRRCHCCCCAGNRRNLWTHRRTVLAATKASDRRSGSVHQDCNECCCFQIYALKGH